MKLLYSVEFVTNLFGDKHLKNYFKRKSIGTNPLTGVSISNLLGSYSRVL